MVLEAEVALFWAGTGTSVPRRLRRPGTACATGTAGDGEAHLRRVRRERRKLRGTTEKIASALSRTGITKTNALEALVIAGFVRGLSVRDVEAALMEALGRTRRSAGRWCRGSARKSRSSTKHGGAVA